MGIAKRWSWFWRDADRDGFFLSVLFLLIPTGFVLSLISVVLSSWSLLLFGEVTEATVVKVTPKWRGGGRIESVFVIGQEQFASYCDSDQVPPERLPVIYLPDSPALNRRWFGMLDLCCGVGCVTPVFGIALLAWYFRFKVMARECVAKIPRLILQVCGGRRALAFIHRTENIQLNPPRIRVWYTYLTGPMEDRAVHRGSDVLAPDDPVHAVQHGYVLVRYLSWQPSSSVIDLPDTYRADRIRFLREMELPEDGRPRSSRRDAETS